MRRIIEILRNPEIRDEVMELGESLGELVGIVAEQVLAKGAAGTGSDRDASPSNIAGVVPYGKPKIGGGHNHTFNKGEDRTPAQKTGDSRRRKS